MKIMQMITGGELIIAFDDAAKSFDREVYRPGTEPIKNEAVPELVCGRRLYRLHFHVNPSLGVSIIADGEECIAIGRTYSSVETGVKGWPSGFEKKFVDHFVARLNSTPVKRTGTPTPEEVERLKAAIDEKASAELLSILIECRGIRWSAVLASISEEEMDWMLNSLFDDLFGVQSIET